MKKKLITAAVSVALVVLSAGWRSSPKGVAEDFVNAVIQCEPVKAFKFYDMVMLGGASDYKMWTSEDAKKLKGELESLGKEINDTKYEGEAIMEVIRIPPEDSGFMLVNGRKYTGEQAEVTVQFVKGRDRKPSGLKVSLVKVDDTWKVVKHAPINGLDTSGRQWDEDDDNEARPRRSRVRAYDRDNGKKDEAKKDAYYDKKEAPVQGKKRPVW